MPNPYFQFKEFTVHHDQCAMKVCTDACILGAWFARKIITAEKILDIGAGSGLLTLMLAQKINARLHGIEKDISSYHQLQQNIENSNWKNRIDVFSGDAVEYQYPCSYDFIISNPPFYENDLKSLNEKKNLAKHDTGLTMESLTTVIDQRLTHNGSFGILLPFHRTAEYEKIALSKGFLLSSKLLIKQTPGHNFFRSILHFTRAYTTASITEELLIKAADGSYSKGFVSLMKDYYLHL